MGLARMTLRSGRKNKQKERQNNDVLVKRWQSAETVIKGAIYTKRMHPSAFGAKSGFVICCQGSLFVPFPTHLFRRRGDGDYHRNIDDGACCC
jgi:hypothetical protein